MRCHPNEADGETNRTGEQTQGMTGAWAFIIELRWFTSEPWRRITVQWKITKNNRVLSAIQGDTTGLCGLQGKAKSINHTHYSCTWCIHHIAQQPAELNPPDFKSPRERNPHLNRFHQGRDRDSPLTNQGQEFLYMVLELINMAHSHAQSRAATSRDWSTPSQALLKVWRVWISHKGGKVMKACTQWPTRPKWRKGRSHSALNAAMCLEMYPCDPCTIMQIGMHFRDQHGWSDKQ